MKALESPQHCLTSSIFTTYCRGCLHDTGTSSSQFPLVALYSFTWYRYESYRYKFTPVTHTGTKRSYRYEIWPHSVPVSCKGGTRLRSGMRWVAELTGTGSKCVSIVNNALNWLVRTRAHKKLCVISVKWLPCKRGTKLDFVPKWNSYRYHVNTPLLSLMRPDSHLICKDYMRSTGVTTSLGSLLLSLIIHALYFVNQTLGSHGLEVILFKGDSLMV